MSRPVGHAQSSYRIAGTCRARTGRQISIGGSGCAWPQKQGRRSARLPQHAHCKRCRNATLCRIRHHRMGSATPARGGRRRPHTCAVVVLEGHQQHRVGTVAVDEQVDPLRGIPKCCPTRHESMPAGRQLASDYDGGVCSNAPALRERMQHAPYTLHRSTPRHQIHHHIARSAKLVQVALRRCYTFVVEELVGRQMHRVGTAMTGEPLAPDWMPRQRGRPCIRRGVGCAWRKPARG